MTSKVPLPVRGTEPPPNTWFIGPYESTLQTAYRSVLPFLPARRYDSEGNSLCPCLCVCVCVCVSVCLSQVGVLSKWINGSSWFLARRLLSTSPTLCFKEIQVSTTIMVFLSGTLSKTPALEKFSLGMSIIETCYRLSSRKVDAQCATNWTGLSDTNKCLPVAQVG